MHYENWLQEIDYLEFADWDSFESFKIETSLLN